MSKKKTNKPVKALSKSTKKKAVAEKNQTPVLQKIEKPLEIKNEVEISASKNKSFSGRDNTKYQFNSSLYTKGRLVLAVVKEYASKHPKAGLNELTKAFPKELQKYYGVIVPLNEAKKKSEHYPRYFIGEKEPIKLADGTSVAVTTQWGADNINPFIETAKKLGFNIKETK